ncbi:MAG: protein-L-isoaspartate O-methyltransferase [Candidatus Nealsonbacteria bacterium]
MPLIENLISEKWLKSSRIIKAFRKIKREDFLPEDLKDSSELDIALPIGFNQTISQPQVVALMLELLDAQEGNNVLDIGSGSGWTSSLLTELVGENGAVTAVEIIPELKELGEKNASRYNFKNVEFILADESKRYEKKAPFDRILISAVAEKVQDYWLEQLKEGGNLVFPMDSSIWKYSKIVQGRFKKQEYPGYVFVPLMEKYE